MWEKFFHQALLHGSSHYVNYRRLNDLFAPELKQDDPLDLSILLSGGKEINKDSLSKGD